MIFPHFSDEEILHKDFIRLFYANVSASWHAKTVMRYSQVDWYFYGAYRGAHIPPKPLENGCPMAEMFIPRTREIWNAATCSTYVNCSAKQAAPLAFRSAPSRFTPRLHYTISNKPEYCILRSRVFRSSGFSSARVQWNVRIRFIFCRKICTGISVDESELSFVSRRKKWFVEKQWKLSK